MSRRDYVAIADILSRAGHIHPDEQRLFITNELADLFAQGNSRFDRVKFLHASCKRER